MSHYEENTGKHPKQEFQVERLAFFSDAVFAIAITLLIIEFKVPHITANTTAEQVWEQLYELKTGLFSLLLSYLLIAVYWIRHHFLYKYIHDYNQQVVVANLFALLPVIFLPFSSAFFAEAIQSKSTSMLGLQVFCINHFAINVAIFALYWLCIVKHKHLSYEIPTNEKIKFFEETISGTLIFAFIFLSTIIMENYDRILYIMLLCAVVRLIVRLLLKKKMAPVNK